MLRGSDNYACVPWLSACISPVGRALRTQQKVSRRLAPAMEHGANPSARDVGWRGVFGSKCTHRPIRINTSWNSQHAKSLAPTSLFPLPWPTFRGPRMGLDAWGWHADELKRLPGSRGRSGLREGRVVFVGHPTPKRDSSSQDHFLRRNPESRAYRAPQYPAGWQVSRHPAERGRPESPLRHAAYPTWSPPAGEIWPVSSVLVARHRLWASAQTVRSTFLSR